MKHSRTVILWQLDQPLLRMSIKCEITHFLHLTIPDNLNTCKVYRYTEILKKQWPFHNLPRYNLAIKVTRHLCCKITPLLHVSLNNSTSRPCFKNLYGLAAELLREMCKGV